MKGERRKEEEKEGGGVRTESVGKGKKRLKVVK